MKLLFENWRKYIKESAFSGNGPLSEPIEEQNDETSELEGEGGKIHIQARAREDADPENPYQMAEYVITLPGGQQKVVPNQESFENGIGGTIGIAFYNAYDLDWNKTPENKIPGFKGPTLPGGIAEDGSLLDNKRGDFQIYIDGFDFPKVGPASDELIEAFSNIRSVGVTPHKPHSGESSREQYYDTYKERPGRGYDSSAGWDRRNFR